MDGTRGGLPTSRDHAGWVEGAGGPCRASGGHIGPEGPPGATTRSWWSVGLGGPPGEGNPWGWRRRGSLSPQVLVQGAGGGICGVQGGRGQSEEWGWEHPVRVPFPVPPSCRQPLTLQKPRFVPKSSHHNGGAAVVPSALLFWGHSDIGTVAPSPSLWGARPPGGLQPRSREPPSTPSPPPHKCSPHPPPWHPAGPHSPIFGVSLPGGAWGGGGVPHSRPHILTTSPMGTPGWHQQQEAQPPRPHSVPKCHRPQMPPQRRGPVTQNGVWGGCAPRPHSATNTVPPRIPPKIPPSPPKPGGRDRRAAGSGGSPLHHRLPLTLAPPPPCPPPF